MEGGGGGAQLLDAVAMRRYQTEQRYLRNNLHFTIKFRHFHYTIHK